MQELEQQATPPAASAAATDGNHAATVCALARVCGWQALESLSKEMLVEIVLLQNQVCTSCLLACSEGHVGPALQQSCFGCPALLLCW